MIGEIGFLELLPATHVTSAGTVNGTVIDLGTNFISVGKRAIKVVLSVDAVSGTSPTLSVRIQEGNEASGSDMADIHTFPQITTTDTFAIADVHVTKRYIRAVRVTGGTTPVYTVACVAAAVERFV